MTVIDLIGRQVQDAKNISFCIGTASHAFRQSDEI